MQDQDQDQDQDQKIAQNQWKETAQSDEKRKVQGKGQWVILQVDSHQARGTVPSHIRALDPLGREWRPGSRWALQARLKAVRSVANPFGIDLERSRWLAGIQAVASLRQERTRLADAAFWVGAIDRIRWTLQQRVHRILGQTRQEGLVLALSLGIQQDIQREDWQLFSRLGINHLVAISGLHLGVVAGCVAYLARWGMQSWGELGRHLPPRIWVALITLCITGLYAMLAGFSLPTQRAMWMIATATLMLLWRRSLSPARIALCALSVVLIFDPFAVLAPGLWLSFGLVLALIFLTQGRRKPLRGWDAALKIQLALSVLLIVPLTYFFGAYPLLSCVINLIAIPFVTCVLMPLCFAAILCPFEPLLQLAASVSALFLQGLSFFKNAPILWITSPPLFLSLLALIGSIALVMPRGWPHRWLGALLLLPYLSYQPPLLPHGIFRMTALDVGQGLSVLIETRFHRMLYDTGALAADRVILPQLRGLGIRSLDTLVLSHHDFDHDGAAPELVQQIPVGKILAGQAQTWKQAAHPAIGCKRGQRWDWDGVSFEVLSPQSEASGHDKNAQSCVIRVAGSFHAALLTGDIPAHVESELVQAGLSKSSIMLSPHHGSRTSSSEVFLQAVQPRWILISAGYANRYGHPHETVLQRSGRRGAHILRTDESGMIRLEAFSSLRRWEYRKDEARYWRPR